MSNEAKNVLDQYWDLLLPVDVEDIAIRWGAVIQDLDIQKFPSLSGMASIDPSGRKLIYVNPNESLNRRRFTIAHELGHHVLGHTLSGQMCRDNFTDGVYHPEEVAANQFAAEILMPSKAVLRLAGSKDARTEFDLAILFNVSLEAVHWKLVNLGVIY